MLVICGGGLTVWILWVWTILCGMSLWRERAHGSSAITEAWRQTTHTSQRNKQREILFSSDVFHFSLATFKSWLCTWWKVHILSRFFWRFILICVILNLLYQGKFIFNDSECVIWWKQVKSNNIFSIHVSRT